MEIPWESELPAFIACFCLADPLVPSLIYMSSILWWKFYCAPSLCDLVDQMTPRMWWDLRSSGHTVTWCPMVRHAISIGPCGKPDTDFTWTTLAGRREHGLPPKPWGLLLGLVRGFLQNSVFYRTFHSHWVCWVIMLKWLGILTLDLLQSTVLWQPYWLPESRLELHVWNSEKPTKHGASLFVVGSARCCNSLLGFYPKRFKTYVHRKTYTQMFIWKLYS